MFHSALRLSEVEKQAKDEEIAELNQQIQANNEEMDTILEERDQALQDATDFEHDMIEAQDDLNTFKAANLPIEGNWDETFIEYGEQDNVEMAPAGVDDEKMIDLEEPGEPMKQEEPEEPEDLGQE